MSTTGTDHTYAEGYAEASWRALPDHHRCQCDDCGWRGPWDALDAINDIYERIDEGETMAAGECPECGSLVRSDDCEQMLRRRDDQATAARVMLAALERFTEADKGGDWDEVTRRRFAISESIYAAIAQAKAAGIGGEP